jgi:hypothetical protein
MTPAPGQQTGPPRRRLLAKLASLSIGIVLALVLGEALILVAVGERPKFPRRVVAAPWGLRYNDPGATYRHKSRDGAWYFRINGQGMRADREYRHEKPQGLRRIVVLGDSFTIGYEVDVEQTYAMVLERELRRRGVNVEVINAGVSGYSTAEAELYLERELIKYDPDAVVYGFYPNDFSDNIRSDLFRLEGDRLVTGRETYVPAGGVGDFLNTNPLFNLVSERSNAFAFAKEELTLLAKATLESLGGRKEAAAATVSDVERTAAEGYERRLLTAIVERMHDFLHQRGIPLVILNIPRSIGEGLLDEMPRELTQVARSGLYFVSGKDALGPYVGDEELYNRRFSMNHWTPIAHEAAGQALARLSVWDSLR